ncbi:MAG TPA: hypothetical protein VGF83_01845 [Actinomycetota bacterium]
MALTKHRIYGTYPQTNLATLYAPPTTPLGVAHHVAPGGTDDTFLRLRAQFQMSVIVGSTDPPPEAWWPSCSVTLIAWWRPDAATGTGAANGTSEHYLGSAVLGSTIVPSPTAPDEYTVLWRMEEDLVTQTYRHDLEAAAGPSVNLGLVVYDTEPALTGLYSSIRIDYEARLFTAWGTPT